MIFDSKKNIDIKEAREKLKYLIKNEKVFELTQKRKKRSIPQNAYLHVLFDLYGIEFGYTCDESKTQIKRVLKYFYVKNGETFLMKTSKMNTKELSIFIEKFRNFSSKNGCYLPSADEYLFNHTEYDRSISKHEIYLR